MPTACRWCRSNDSRPARVVTHVMVRLMTGPWLLRLYRAAVLAAIVVLIHQQSRWLEAQRSPAISLATVKKFLTDATRVELGDIDRGLYFARNARGETVGCVLTTSPFTDQIIGYSGPNNLLIVIDASGTVAGVELLNSGDTPDHVEKVKADPEFWQRFIGWNPGEKPPPVVSGVSGATLTSFAIAESIQQRLAGATPSLRFPEPVTLAEVHTLFTNATQMVIEPARVKVLDPSGRVLGFAVRTSPQADNVAGYRGPTECLVGLAPDARTVVGVRLRKSYDTASYVNQIPEDPVFLKSFAGRTIEQIAALDFAKEKIEGVSGATQTSFAVAESLKRRFAAELKTREQSKPWRPQPRDVALALVILGAIVISFSSLRGKRWMRIAWQFGLVAYVGLVNHDLLSLALFGGWAAHGVALKAAPGLVLLAVAALMVPWSTRRQLYCHQLCPHGAAQQLLGGLFHHRWTVPVKLMRVLEWIPTSLLAVSLVVVLFGWSFSLANLEPFDAWVWRTAGIATVVLAIAGLVASLFVSQAYCRFGCPTGAVLSFVRSSGSADHWGRRDCVALFFLVGGILAALVARQASAKSNGTEPLAWHGRTMGTTWSIKYHEVVADPQVVETAVADEYERIEAMTSHWRSNTPLSRFNQADTTNGVVLPSSIISLVRQAAEISRATGGAYDITVGSLVKLWGFGPAPRRSEPPSDREIEALRPALGWQKLEVVDNALRKHHPQIEIDFSSVVPGWANDQVAQLLEQRGLTNFLVESGGELRASGVWTIAIEHPLRSCTLINESIGTSGTYRQNWKSNGHQFSHLLDPRTGRPVTHNTVSVSVRHDDCARADAWATALNVMGVESGLPLAEELNVAAQFVTEDAQGQLKVRQSTAWTARELAARDAR